MCGTGTSKPVCHHKNLPFPSNSRRKHQSSKGMHTYRHTRHPRSHHTEQPPLWGVMECTICGFSLRNVRHNCHKDFISLIGEIWRSIFTSIHFISGWDLYILSHSGPGDDNKTTSYFFCKSESIPATKPKD